MLRNSSGYFQRPLKISISLLQLEETIPINEIILYLFSLNKYVMVIPDICGILLLVFIFEDCQYPQPAGRS